MEESSINFEITESAAKKIAELLEAESDNSVFRISVDGGGCSGFQYKYDLEPSLNTEDLVLTKGKAVIAIDQISQSFLNGSMIDFIETLGSASFKISNPNATAKCGCGNSFSV